MHHKAGNTQVTIKFSCVYSVSNSKVDRLIAQRFRHIQHYSITVHERDLRKNNLHLSAAFEMLRMRMVLVNPILHAEPVEA